MTQTLYGVHDQGAESLMTEAGVRGWVVTTHALSQDQYGYNYGGPHTPIARLNWGYWPHGTVPPSGTCDIFPDKCASWVRQSQACHCWIIGNEPNHKQQEWPPDGPITAMVYKHWYQLCRAAIRSVPGHEDDQVIIAAVAPWNDACGDWVDYFADILDNIDTCDGFALHAYTHGHDPKLVNDDDTTMGPPYQDRHYNWIAYRDFLQAVPVHMRHLPVYITEADPDMAWKDENNGWVQAAYGDLNWWNIEGRFKPEYTDPTGMDAVARGVPCNAVHALCLYRWQNLDKWGFSEKQGVHDDFRAAMSHGYAAPGGE